MEGAFKCKQHPKAGSTDTTETNSSTAEDEAILRHRRYGGTINTGGQEEPEAVWLRRDDFREDTPESSTTKWTELQNLNDNSRDNNNKTNNTIRRTSPNRSGNTDEPSTESSFTNTFLNECKNQNELFARKIIIAEWQRIAAVTDRILFWFYFVSTLASYIVILLVIPNSNYARWNAELQPMRPMSHSTT